MTYYPLTEMEKVKWFNWLLEQVQLLNGRPEYADNQIFGTPDGDVIAAKDLVGNFLATLSNDVVIID